MAFNNRTAGDTQEFIVPESVKSGDIVKVGRLVGVAEIDAAQREDGEFYATIALEGVVAVKLAEAPEAGDPIGVAADAADGTVEVAVASSGQALLGYVLNPVASASGRYEVKIANGLA